MNQSNENPTVFVLGLRGFPDVQGGVETHAENLYPLIVERGFDVICATRSPFRDPDISTWNGVRLMPLWSPRSKYFEAIVHSVLSVLKAAFLRPDIVHIHAVGPALATPLARLFGLKTVVTHHGPDYDREKWGNLARRILRLGERLGMTFSNERIVITDVISRHVSASYDKTSVIIPNGVPIPELDADQEYLGKHSLESGRYIILVSRFVPEKRHLDLVKAFQAAGVPGWKLALVGDADHPSEYVETLRSMASESDDIVLTGFVSGEELKSIYQHAGLFVLPSSHEGLPISLLEALSFGLPCLASDIPANLCVALNDRSYFELGNIEQLTRKIEDTIAKGCTPEDRERTRDWVAERYNWEGIADRTAEVYRQMSE